LRPSARPPIGQPHAPRERPPPRGRQRRLHRRPARTRRHLTRRGRPVRRRPTAASSASTSAPCAPRPGCGRVISAADIPGDNDCGPVVHDDPILAAGEVLFHGQPLFAVAADTRDAGPPRRPPRRGAHRAAAGRARHRRRPCRRQRGAAAGAKLSRGDVDAALAAAPHRLAGRDRTGGQEHYYLEGQVACAIPRERRQPAPAQLHPAPHRDAAGGGPRPRLAHAPGELRMPPDGRRLRRQGGAVGPVGLRRRAARAGQRAAGQAAPRPRRRHARHRQAPRLPHRLRRRLRRRRPAASARPAPRHVSPRAAASRPTCRARSTTARCSTPTTPTTSTRWPSAACAAAPTPCPTPPSAASADPRACSPSSAVLDDIARHLGLDPLAVRRANFYAAPGRDTHPLRHAWSTTTSSPRWSSASQASADYTGRRAEIAAFNAASSGAQARAGAHPGEVRHLLHQHLPQPGRRAGACVQGRQRAASATAAPRWARACTPRCARSSPPSSASRSSDVRLSATDTSKVPNTSATAASSGSDLNGKAAQAACRAIRGRLAAFASPAGWAQAPPSVRFEAGRVRAPGFDAPFAQVALDAWLARVQLWDAGFYATPKIHYDASALRGRPFYYFAYGAAAERSRHRHPHRRTPPAARRHPSRRRPLHQPGHRHRPDRRRLHPGPRLADQRRAGLRPRWCAAHPLALHLQDPHRRRPAAGLQRAACTTSPTARTPSTAPRPSANHP
jgi:xanthine dehydrogenase large subunit